MAAAASVRGRSSPPPPAAPEPAPDRATDWVADGTPEPLRSALVSALGPDRVLTRTLDLIRYASDASPYRLIPRAVAVPRGIGDVVKLLGCATEFNAPLVFRAGGTSLNGQSQTESILDDARRPWRRIRIEDGGAHARVQPGDPRRTAADRRGPLLPRR
jgi:D-lactate dehydrogenase